MFLEDVPVNHLAVLLAAILYLGLGALWYSPWVFGHCPVKHDGEGMSDHKCSTAKCIGAYIVEFFIALIIAYVLALFIEISQADAAVEGVTVAIWTWLGFIATTHFSGVLWGHKSVKNFFIHSGFLLIGLIAMGAVITAMGL